MKYSTAVDTATVSTDVLRSSVFFRLQTTQVAAKEVVRYAPPQNRDAALADADRKLAAGESLLPKIQGSASVFRRA